MTMPETGEKAPPFSLPSDGGETISLQQYRGRPVVLYFYPKDDTPGCTIEACEFRDRWEDVMESGAIVLGVSPDPVDSHEKFKEKFDLPFPLLADTEHRAAEDYGVWGEKSMYGRKYLGVNRSTFIIDGEGRIARIFHKVKPRGHAAEVLEALNALGNSTEPS